MSSIVVRLWRPRHRPFRVFHPRVTPEQRRHQVYELAKEHWDRAHPEATPTERDVASVEIARRLGIAQ